MGRRPRHGRGSGRNSDTRVSRDGLAEPVRVPRPPPAEGIAAARCLLGEERRGGHGRGGAPSHSTARAAAAGREGAAPQPWPGHALGSLWPWGWHATVAEPPQGRVCPASSGTAARTADPESEAQRRRRARRSAVRPRGAGGRPGLWGTSQGRGVPGHAAAPIRGLFAHV